MRLKKRYLCTALSLAFTQQAVAAQESDSLTVNRPGNPGD